MILEWDVLWAGVHINYMAKSMKNIKITHCFYLTKYTLKCYIVVSTFTNQTLENPTWVYRRHGGELGPVSVRMNKTPQKGFNTEIYNSIVWELFLTVHCTERYSSSLWPILHSSLSLTHTHTSLRWRNCRCLTLKWIHSSWNCFQSGHPSNNKCSYKCNIQYKCLPMKSISPLSLC